MTLATLDSLSHGLNYNDIMQRFCNWKVRADYTATGIVFDMGVTTRTAPYRLSLQALLRWSVVANRRMITATDH